jgi:hypothetical protein
MTSLFAPRPAAALEFSFFKVNAGPVALLVDWIDRRPEAQRWLRVSIHSPRGREVLFQEIAQAAPAVGGSLSEVHTQGYLGDVSWSLDIDTGPDRIAPDVPPAGLLRMADLALESAPLTGTIRHRGQDFEVRGAPGHLSHYWGRQLPAEWWWVSASQFEGVDLAVECGVIRSAVWGAPVRLPLGYLYLRRPDSAARALWMAPMGLARVKGTPDAFEIRIRRMGAPTVSLACTGRDFGDLGEGIMNTLVGDVEVREGGVLLARAHGTAALERRSGRPPDAGAIATSSHGGSRRKNTDE